MIDLECEKERQARSGIHTVDCPFNRPASLVPVPTDYFIKASIPGYDKNPIWFVRTKGGGWFSFETVACWMSGRLMEAGFDYEE